MDATASRAEAAPTSRRGIPSGLLGMLALAIGFEWFIHAHASHLSEMNATDWSLTRQAATREAREADVLIFGDSLLKFGVVPELLGERLGRRVFNLSVLGGQAGGSYFLLRRALESGSKPKAVVLDCQDSPVWVGDNTTGAGLRRHLRLWVEGLGLRDGWQLAASANDPEFFAELALRKLLPTLHLRADLPRNFARIVRGRMTHAHYLSLIQKRNWRLNLGSILMPEREDFESKLMGNSLPGSAALWKADPVSLEYLEKFLALAADRGISVYFVLPPTSPDHDRDRQVTGVRDFMTASAREMRANHPEIRVIDARSSGFTRDFFIDDSHLSRRGAVAFTDGLADAIRASTPADWVELSLPRPRARPHEMEDLDQSRLALDSYRAPRR